MGEPSSETVIRKIEDRDREALAALIEERWGGPTIVTRARIHDAVALPGFLASDGEQVVGAITLSVQGKDCEVVTLDSVREGRGVGAALLEHAERWAGGEGCERLWAVTTNDNLRAIGFYQRRGFRIMAVHRDAVERCRELKPSIPTVGQNGIPVLDEIELEKQIAGSPSPTSEG